MSLATDLLADLARLEKKKQDERAPIGISAVGGCQANAVLALRGVPETNTGTNALPAHFGTAIHERIQQARAYRAGILQEIEVVVDVDGYPIPGHLDEFDPFDGVLVDWKTTSRDRLSIVRSEGIDRAQEWQRHLYAEALRRMGYEVRVVANVFIARDGDEADVHEDSRAFDPAIVEEAIAGFREIRRLADLEIDGKRERPYGFCRDWCGRFTACRGGDAGADLPTLDDATLSAARSYLQAHRDETDAKDRKKAYRAALLGASGEVDGIRVTWTRSSVKSTEEIDPVAARTVLELAGLDVPMRVVEKETSSRLLVKEVSA
jgi:hypothetical protein